MYFNAPVHRSSPRHKVVKKFPKAHVGLPVHSFRAGLSADTSSAEPRY